MVKFHSTNLRTPDVDFKTAVLRGQALDKGLYMLNEFPRLTYDEIYSFKNLKPDEIGFVVISKIIGDEIIEEDLKRILKTSLNFDVPIEEIGEENYICFLDQGPTASFKDFGARTLAQIMEYFLEMEDKNAVILTATSGDTGSAVAQAFYNMKRIKVIVLFPKDEVSELQRKQMTTLGKNITTLGISGKFDDCQDFVKFAFADKDLKQYNLTSANSINLGRLLPQIIYYFLSYAQVIEEKKEQVIYSVPSGNFGNLMGGLIAFKMGLPVKKFIAAVNENDEFPKLLETEIYKKVKPSKKCISNAMNVGHPSNLARLIDLYEGHMDETGKLQSKPNFKAIRNDIASYSISDTLTKKTIVDFYNDYNKIIEPHGAVGWAALQLFRKENSNLKGLKSIAFETADPAKFPDNIVSLIKIKPKLPNSLKKIKNKSEFPNPIEINKYEDFKLFLLKNL